MIPQEAKGRTFVEAIRTFFFIFYLLPLVFCPFLKGHLVLQSAPLGWALLGCAPLGWAPLGWAPLGWAPLGWAPLG